MSDELVAVGALLSDRTRVDVLASLMDGRAHTGAELARHVGVAPSTISEHLSKLLDGRMVTVEAQGRHRYYRLAGPEVADMFESLSNFARIDTPKAARVPAGLAHARTCYNHLAGDVAVQIYARLLSDGYISALDQSVMVTAKGMRFLRGLGVNTNAIAAVRGAQARCCLDWTQRRHHLAGVAGAELLRTLLANHWVRPCPQPRALRVTSSGKSAFATHFRITA